VCVVFGCGGGRDIHKRPKMGEIAGRIADHVVLTSDNPRNEDPVDIIKQIQAGLPDSEKTVVYPDRAMALAYAAGWARGEDTVLVAGKGHEAYQEIKDVRHPFSDREQLEKLLQKR